MKTVGVMAVVLILLVAGAVPAAAYYVDLTVWNTSELEAAGDYVRVEFATVGTDTTMTFTWVDGDSTFPTAHSLMSIVWTAAVTTIGGVPTGANPTDYTIMDCSVSQGGGGCTGDGLQGDITKGGGFSEGWDDGSQGAGSRYTSVSFTFAGVHDFSSLTADDFAVHVKYDFGPDGTGSCSGWVGGTLKDPGGATSDPGCTPVPEPATMFLAGTGLLAFVYAARKRLFGGRIAR